MSTFYGVLSIKVLTLLKPLVAFLMTWISYRPDGVFKLYSYLSIYLSIYLSLYIYLSIYARLKQKLSKDKGI